MAVTKVKLVMMMMVMGDDAHDVSDNFGNGDDLNDSDDGDDDVGDGDHSGDDHWLY